MARFALVFVLSLTVTAPAWACGMSMRGFAGLGGAFDAVDVEPLADEAVAEVPRVNWIEEVGTVGYGSLPRELRGRRETGAGPLEVAPEAIGNVVASGAPVARPGIAVQAARAEPMATDRTVAPTVDPSAAERVRALLRAFLSESEPASVADTADTGDTAAPQ